MEAKDLMIGDLVYDMTDGQNVKVIRINNIIVDDDFECVNATFKNGYIDECVDCKNIAPIQIRHDFMIKNGFKKNIDGSYSEPGLFLCNVNKIEINFENYGNAFINCFTVGEHRFFAETSISVGFIHRLQQFMRSIGFAKEANNFKI